MGPERQPPAHHPNTEVQTNSALETVEGSSCAVQTLYEGAPKCRCCKNWVIDYPEDLRVAVEDQLETKQKALVLRMSKSHDADGGKPLVLNSVVVQSSSLKKTLSEVFVGFKGITPSLKKLVFRAPFKPFHHRWSRFTEILERQKTDDPDAAAYTQLLYDVLDVEIRDVRANVADLLDNGVITYSLLWALFEPGMTVCAHVRGHQRFYVVESREYEDMEQNFVLQRRFIDWDGTRFGYVSEGIRIPRFPGTRGITELPAFPAAFHPNKEVAEASAVARGRLFEDLAGIHYKAYSGIMVYNGKRETRETIERQQHTSGRIVIDAAGYLQAESNEDDHGGSPFMAMGSLDAASSAPQLDLYDDFHREGPFPPLGPHPGQGYYGGIRPGMPPPPPRGFVPHHLSHRNQVEPWSQRKLTPKQLLLCTPTVRGYSLKLQEWGHFSVSQIVPIAFNDAAFPNLMLPPTYKDLVLSFVEAHPSTAKPRIAPKPDQPNLGEDIPTTTTTPDFDDLIEGKGLGVILLLVGNPGTGKTLTAEAVADKVRRPLYVLSAGELGQRVEDVERRLRGALELAERWDAVLLFDECDVFLQERSVGAGGMWDLARNEVVAVFLRLLEYYRGILFMTTNRQDTLDKAFHSRVHLTLRYPDLDAAAKEHIWHHFTKLGGAGDGFPAETYEQLARLPLNGRQIRNTIKIASLVATRLKVPLAVEHVWTALQVTRGSDGAGLSA